GIPHAVSEDDVYCRYHIPKDLIIITNVWTMFHDEKYYAKPYRFNPDRFLKNGKINADVPDPTSVVTCPGMHIGWDAVWLTVASVLSAFNITKAINDNGRLIEPTKEYESTITYLPLPFKCTIKPRSKEVDIIIQTTVEHTC
ncbi:cytochrome P450, partial [Crucibulum laeve]